MIQFLLNQELKQETQLDPNMTVLTYLRQHLRKTGTKEGCASGDCGACSVVLADVVHGKLRYRSINACLTFVSALHGKQLITVEDLQNQGKLHTAQQAMADCHGSQCGFCTPGFVMSLFALQKNVKDKEEDAAGSAEIQEALAGNLCRCTGYRPIIEAAQQTISDRTSDQFDAQENATIARLQTISKTAPALLTDNGNTVYIPTKVEHVTEYLSVHPNARLLAGGTDLALEVTQFHRSIESLIYLGNVSELSHIDDTSDTNEITLGAAAPLSDCYSVLARYFPDFGELLHRFASLQIRNQGTLGGNIGNASPIGDSPPLLIALGASVILRSRQGSRRLALEDFFIDYKQTALAESEFIEKIIIPKPTSETSFKAYKVSKRLDDDISAVCAAINVEITNTKVTKAILAFGGMAAIPKRATQAEASLLGQEWNSNTIEKACEALATDFSPLSDFRASHQYRTLISQNLLRKYFIERSSEQDAQPQFYDATRVTAHV
ncbi:xanthine dehydrogenase small subunit [Marinomonas balearica]|uniref:Xanthine dehydrogenase small subunit n=1 Tax=Marinomonas balearica TaxID=491947 RepID=A0A4R6MC04_9GAMM|nr:xanthine dehydrogenase small subunit [Marinomonas balearica]TDO98856.1 xanthine dehydrogenase small subunit [Marinomonas balearica]